MELSLLCNSEIILCIVENSKTNMFSSIINQKRIIEIMENNIKPSVEKKTFFTTKNVRYSNLLNY